MRRVHVASAFVALSALMIPMWAFADDLPEHFEPGKEYMWYADIVSIDHAVGTLTAKARLRYDIQPEYEQFKPGEQIALQWYTSAWGDTDRIQHMAPRDQINGLGFYVMPVEFVSLDRATKMVTFKMTMKGAAVQAMKSISPKASVRVTSLYWPAAADNAILSVEKRAATPHDTTD